MRYLILSFFISIKVIILHGQIAIEDITLVKSFQNKYLKTEPAVFTLTIPENGDPSYLVNAGLGIDIAGLITEDRDFLKIFPFIELNKNTLVDKVQDQLTSGLSVDWAIFSEERKFLPSIIMEVKYANDQEKTVESFQSSLLFSPRWLGITTDVKNFYYPDNLVSFGGKKWGAFEYIPYLGLETENRFMNEDTAKEGDIYRLVGKLQSNLYFIPKRDEKDRLSFYRLLITCTYQFREELSNTVTDNPTNNDFLETGIAYVLFKDKKKEGQFGVDFVSGQNPTKAFEEQKYFAINVKLKL